MDRDKSESLGLNLGPFAELGHVPGYHLATARWLAGEAPKRSFGSQSECDQVKYS